MKLRNIFTMLAASLAFAFVGCQEEERFLDEVKVSQSYIAIDAAGGSVEVTVDATDAWEITDIPEWLTVTPASGAAGQTTVTFSAAKAESTNEALVYLNCAGAQQIFSVLQMTEKVELPISSCLDVINGVDGVTYRVKGTVTSIANTTYGNWYLQDETGSVYIYGTLYEGAEKQFEKLGLEVGDIVTCEGPRKDYSGTIELVNVTVIEIEKSLIKIDEVSPEEGVLPLEGGEFTVSLTCKGEGVSVVIPEDAQSWLAVKSVTATSSSAVVTFAAAENMGGAREAELSFVTKSKGVEYMAVTTLSQEGSILEVSVADFLAAAEGTALYKLTGKVEKLQTGDYGNFNLVDATGSVYVYGLTATPVEKNDKSFPTLGIKEGDVVTLIGTRASYNGTAQVGGPAYYVSHIGHTESTVANFLAQEKSKEKWYKLTGTIESIVKEEYGNFYLKDETGTVYVYGLTVAPVAKNDKSFTKLGLKVGDKVTIVGTRDRYDAASDPTQADQVGGPAYYISHETPAADGGNNDGGNDEGGNDEVVAGTYTYTLAQGDLGANGTPDAEVTLGSVKWNFSMTDSGSKYLGWDSNESAKGVQIGKSKDPATEVVLSTSAIKGTVKSIKVNTSGASDTDAKLNVTVGGSAFGSEATLTNAAAEYTFSGSASGEIVLKWTATQKAIYLKSIEIVTE